MRALVAGNVDRQVEFNWSQPREDDFKTVFADIKSRIAREELHKAVPAVFEVSKQTLTPSELRICLAHLVSAASSVIVYGMWYDGKGILGATPETLFTLTENELATMALAGTLPKSPFASPQQLIEDPKERHEHDLVVQDLAHQLSGLGRVDKGTLEVLELPHLFHLRTLLKVRLPRAVHADEMLRLLHPTPALGVSPRQYGYHWLSRFAQQELRSRFGAPLVFSLGGELTLALVAIRNVQWNSEGTVLGSGCGIVAESELAKEWLELKAKRDSVKKLLGFKL